MLKLSEFLKTASINGIAISGGHAVQHFLPKEFRSTNHDDIDLILPIIDDLDPENIIRRITSGEIKVIKDNQPRRIVYETYQTIEDAYDSRFNEKTVIHIEATPIRVPTFETRLNYNGNNDIIARLPDPNYLFARILYGAGSSSRPWHRRLDDLGYMCHMTRFVDQINKAKVLDYLVKLSGGQSNANQVMINLREVIKLATIEELKERVAHRTNEEFNYQDYLKRLEDTYSRNGTPDKRIKWLREIYHLPKEHKIRIAKELNTRLSDAEIVKAYVKKEPEHILPKSPEVIARRIIR